VKARSFRLDMIAAFIVVAVITIVFFVMGTRWSISSQQIMRNQKLIAQKELELMQMERFMAYTMDYVRILEALTFLTRGRFTSAQLIGATEMLWKFSRAFDFDPLLVLSLVSVESQGDHLAVGRYRSGAESGAIGFMQVKWETALELAQSLNIELRSPDDLLIPENNLVLGTAYLLKLSYQYQSLRYGIMAYNIGPGAMRKALATGGPLPTRYYNRIFSNYQVLVRRFGPYTPLTM
jgi:soluble lytic murein transglycosylase-like protein